MAVLKAAEFNEATASKQMFNLNDIADEGKAILDNARREKESLLQQARQDIAREHRQVREEGYRSGHEQGLQEGRKEGHEQALQEARQEFAENSAVVRESLEAIGAEFDRIKNELLWQSEQNVVALVLAIARKVVKQAGLLTRDVAMENIKSALELLNTTTNVIVKVNPHDAEHLGKMIQDASSPFAAYSSVCFEKDETIEAGGCRLITEHGLIDGQLDTQIDRIAEELLTTSDKDENEVIAQAGLAPAKEKTK
jgi:flagellar assembly protein FliH